VFNRRHHHRAVIQRVHPHQVRNRLIILGAIGLALGGVGYWLGYEAGQYQPVPLVSEADALRGEIIALETQAAVDEQAIGALREELADGRATIDELERELAFYREVMAPEEITEGVVLRQPILRPGAAPGEWRYQIVVQQGSRRDKSLYKGEVFVTVWGLIAGLPGSFNLAALDTAVTADSLNLSFRYFQRFDGVFSLPPGFEPDRMDIQLDLSKPQKDVIEATYDWSRLIARRPSVGELAPNQTNNELDSP